jgi:hypothetical protein
MTKKVTPLFYHKNHQKIKIFTTKSNVTFDSRNSRKKQIARWIPVGQTFLT